MKIVEMGTGERSVFTGMDSLLATVPNSPGCSKAFARAVDMRIFINISLSNKPPRCLSCSLHTVEVSYLLKHSYEIEKVGFEACELERSPFVLTLALISTSLLDVV